MAEFIEALNYVLTNEDQWRPNRSKPPIFAESGQITADHSRVGSDQAFRTIKRYVIWHTCMLDYTNLFFQSKRRSLGRTFTSCRIEFESGDTFIVVID